MVQGRAPEPAGLIASRGRAQQRAAAADRAWRPLLVCIAPETAEEAAQRLRREGWLVRPGWSLPWRIWNVSAKRVVCWGTLKSEADAHAALLAGIRGAGIVAVADDDWSLLARFYEDLSRIGPVAVCRGEPAGSGACLGAEERRLLELLAGGATLGDAARLLHVSRRTADRRLAAARAALGVRTTAEAVFAFRQEPPDKSTAA